MFNFFGTHPSFTYGLQVYIAEVLFMAFLMPKRKYWWLTLTLCTLCSVAVVTFIPDVIIGHFLYAPFAVIIVLIFVTTILTTDTKINAAIFGSVAVLLMQHTAECVTLTVRYFFEVKKYTLWWDLISIICYGLIYAGLLILFWYKVKDMRLKSGKMVLFAALIFIGVFSIRNYTFSFSDISSETPYTLRVAFNLYAVVSCLFCILFLCSQNSEEKLIDEKSEMERMLNREQEHYQALVQNQEIINRKCHDLKYSIKMLRQDLEGEEKLHYLDKLEQEVMIYEKIAKTGNVSLDHTLSEKCLICAAHDIKFTYMVDAEGLGRMEAIDIYTLFGNAIDNAIECVVKYEDYEKRIISLYVTKQFGALKIHLENYCEEVLYDEQKNIISTKVDKNNHGFGLKSIRYIAEKYNGYMNITNEKRLFCLDILIPLAEQ